MLQKLKIELKARDLDVSGKKADLAERLEAHLQNQPAETNGQANGASSSEGIQEGSIGAAPAKVSCANSGSTPFAAALRPQSTLSDWH